MVDCVRNGKWLDTFTIIAVCLLVVILDGAVGLVIGLVFRFGIEACTKKPEIESKERE